MAAPYEMARRIVSSCRFPHAELLVRSCFVTSFLGARQTGPPGGSQVRGRRFESCCPDQFAAACGRGAIRLVALYRSRCPAPLEHEVSRGHGVVAREAQLEFDGAGPVIGVCLDEGVVADVHGSSRFASSIPHQGRAECRRVHSHDDLRSRLVVCPRGDGADYR